MKNTKKCKVKNRYTLKPLYVLDANFTQIANTMFRYIPNPSDFKVYCYLCFRYNKEYQYAFPSLNTIAKDTCIGLTTVKKSIKWLENKRFIVRYKKKDENTEWMNNCYYVRYVVEDIENVQKNIIDNFEEMMDESFESEIIVEEIIEDEIINEKEN